MIPPLYPNSLDDFVNLVVPEMQKRGLFRTRYEGRTLRENLGLAPRRAGMPQPMLWRRNNPGSISTNRHIISSDSAKLLEQDIPRTKADIPQSVHCLPIRDGHHN